MPIIHNAGGSTSIVGKTSINFYRLVTILSGLRFELRTNGMRLTSRAPSCFTIVRREFPELLAKGDTKEKILEKFAAYVEAMRTQVEHIDNTKGAQQ